MTLFVPSGLAQGVLSPQRDAGRSRISPRLPPLLTGIEGYRLHNRSASVKHASKVQPRTLASSLHPSLPYLAVCSTQPPRSPHKASDARPATRTAHRRLGRSVVVSCIPTSHVYLHPPHKDVNASLLLYRPAQCCFVVSDTRHRSGKTHFPLAVVPPPSATPELEPE